jgi:3-methylcrotonyl-CoA carboxylase alpha subunit
VDGRLVAEVDGRQWRMRARADSHAVTVHDGERRVRLDRVPAFRFQGNAAAGLGDRITAPMPGRIVVIKAQPGQDVAEGEELLVMEAMKMELSLRAPRAGRVAAVQAAAGDFVDADAVLVKLEAAT